jgi:phosphonate transport system permease protein
LSTPQQALTSPNQDVVARFEAVRARYLRGKRLYVGVFWVIFFACLVVSVITTRFDISVLIDGFPRTSGFIIKMIPPLTWTNLWADIANWYWGFGQWLKELFTSVLMAFVATFMGTVIGGALSFMASRNLAKNYWVYFITRRVLEIARTVPDIVWALLFIFPFGVGPIAGVLAITIHTLGATGKLFAEVNENIDDKPLEGVRAAGGNWFEEMRFGVIPQVMPNFISYTFWRLELNVRSATVVGFVGAGGIGFELINAVKLLYFQDVGAILLMVIASVVLIDMASERLRHYMIGKETLVS